MPRSLRVASNCIEQVKRAVQRSGFPRQKDLAEELGLAISTVNNFLNGKSIDCENFLELCRRLDLDWQAITASSNIENSVALAKSQERTLDETKPQDKAILERSCKILWVDDNLAHIQGEVAYLVQQGIRIVVSNETFDAVEKFKNSSFDIVITDMGRLEDGTMNREAGIDLARAIREISEFVPIIIFCIKGKHWIKADEEVGRKGKLAGINRFISLSEELYEYFEVWLNS